MAFGFLLSPPPLPLPLPGATSTYLTSARHGRRALRPLEHGCRCGRPPETAPSSTSSSGGVGSYDRESSFSSVGLEGGASSSHRQTGSADPGYQETSTKVHASNGDYEEWQKKQDSTDDLSKSRSKSRYAQAFGVDLSPDNVAVAIVYFVQGVLGLSRLAVSFYLKDDLRLDPAEVVDSMVVERARGESQSTSGSLQSLCWGSSAFGGVVSAYFSGSLVDTYGVRTNKLGFTPEFLGRVKLVTSVASLLGIGVYNTFLKAVPLRKIFLVTTILGSALGMTQVLLVTGLNRELGISDEWFAIGDSLIITVLGQASFMPVLVLAAKLCPSGVEATLFATLMSISNAGGVAGGLLGAGLTQLFGVTRDDFGNLALLIAICNLSSLLPLPLLNLLPGESPDTDNAQTKID
ncbi:hypothetical protein EJB05_04056, partial [Eragrostis curvula]